MCICWHQMLFELGQERYTSINKASTQDRSKYINRSRSLLWKLELGPKMEGLEHATEREDRWAKRCGTERNPPGLSPHTAVSCASGEEGHSRRPSARWTCHLRHVAGLAGAGSPAHSSAPGPIDTWLWATSALSLMNIDHPHGSLAQQSSLIIPSPELID